MLSQLPPEILGLILDGWHCSYLILRLWKTGNLLLQEKISSGVTDVRFSAHHVLPSKYPRMLSNLRHLRHLSLRSVTFDLFQDPRDWQIELKKLPKTLKSLIIETDDAEYVLRDLRSDWSTDAHRYVERKVNGITTLNNDLGSIFPQLETLDLKIRNFVNFSASSIVGLPGTLTCLNLPAIRLRPTDSFFASQLPRSLKRLSPAIIGKSTTALEAWKDPPPHLEHVSTFYWHVEAGLKPDRPHAWMPPTLTTTGSTVPLIWNKHAWNDIPKHFLALNISAVESWTSESWTSTLPRTLTTLKVPVNLKNAFSLSDAMALPDTLTDLTILGAIDYHSFLSYGEHENQTADENDSQTRLNPWPSSLRQFFTTDAPNECLQLLPRNVTYLVLGNSKGTDDWELDGSRLPRNVTRLELQVSRYNLRIVGKLPPITHILISRASEPQSLYESSFAAIPTSLTHMDLAIRYSLQNPTVFETFSHLVDLTVLNWPIEQWPEIPRSVVILDIGGLIIDQAISQDEDIFQKLPNGLKDLRITVITELFDEESQRMAPSSFSTLVRLESLHIDENMQFSVQILHNLPRSIHNLNVGFFDIEILDQHAHAIPPRLRQFPLPPNSINDKVASHWPLSLKLPRADESATKIFNQRTADTVHNEDWYC